MKTNTGYASDSNSLLDAAFVIEVITQFYFFLRLPSVPANGR